MELDKEAEKKKKKEIKDLHNELKKREKHTIVRQGREMYFLVVRMSEVY